MTVRTNAAQAGYLSLTTVGAGESAPILFSSNPIGEALLSTGLMTLAGPTAASIVPILPVGVAGIDVHETLHRLDADADLPSSERGVTSANRIGERLGSLAMRWVLAPDDFEATPSTPPPPTELDPRQSQRFVMADGVVRFEDRTRSGIRFFGAGRTYPSDVDGASRLLFAGAGVVIEGLGVLKGLRGSVMVIGEIASRTLVSLVVTGRFDDDGPFEAAETLGPLLDGVLDGPDTTVLTLVGESDGGSAVGLVEERLRIARIENDLAHASRPRSLFREGEAVGYATGPLRFDASDRRCAVRLIDGRRELIFTDVAGRGVGTIMANELEGTTYRDEHAGGQASRVIAYGQLSGGTGALSGAGGILTFDTAVSPDGAASSVYTLWLADARGRFRAPGQRRIASTSGADLRHVSAQDFQFEERTALSMLPADLEILDHAERALADGGEIGRWFQLKDRVADYGERFDVAPEFEPDGEGIGFFDTAVVGGVQTPVMGIAQDVFFDRQKAGGHEAIRAQLQEFVLRYFLRVNRIGTGGYQQVYFKIAGTGQIGKFVGAERSAIVDLRGIGTRFEWIVLRMDGEHAPVHLVIGPSFITALDDPEPGVLGEYGFGYAFVPSPSDKQAVRAFAAEPVRAGLQTITFKLTADGEIRARAVSVVNRPDKIAPIDVDPIGWGLQLADMVTFRMASRLMSPMTAVTDRLPLKAQGVDPLATSLWMANAITGGLAEKRFGISKALVEKRMLIGQFKQQEAMLHRALQIWRMVPDWTAAHVIYGSEDLSI